MCSKWRVGIYFLFVFFLISVLLIGSMIFSLIDTIYNFSLPVCIWSDVFPVQRKDTPISQQTISEQWCSDWIQEDKLLEPINIHAPYCPCVASIAENDVGHFHRDPICDTNTNSASKNCIYYPNAQKCFRRNIKR